MSVGCDKARGTPAVTQTHQPRPGDTALVPGVHACCPWVRDSPRRWRPRTSLLPQCRQKPLHAPAEQRNTNCQKPSGPCSRGCKEPRRGAEAGWQSCPGARGGRGPGTDACEPPGRRRAGPSAGRLWRVRTGLPCRARAEGRASPEAVLQSPGLLEEPEGNGTAATGLLQPPLPPHLTELQEFDRSSVIWLWLLVLGLFFPSPRARFPLVAQVPSS